MHPQYQSWYGNQLAVAELAGRRPSRHHSERVIRRIPWKLTCPGKEISIDKLPCEQFNYTPQIVGEDVSSRYVLHFKGHKRHLMKFYAKTLGLGWYLADAPEDTLSDLAMVSSL
jgi:hypothetical protein